MKRFYTTALCILLLAACHNKSTTSQASTFQLSGKLTGGGADMPIYLDRISAEKNMNIDSTRLASDGSFSFHTKGITKGFYVLRLSNSDFATLILDSNEKVSVTGNAQFLGRTYSVIGSPDSKLFCEFNREANVNYAKKDSLEKIFQVFVNMAGNNKKRVDSLSNAIEAPYDTIENQQERYVRGFIKTHIASFASLAAIQQLDPDKDFSCYISLDSALSKLYPSSSYVTLFHDKVNNMKRVAIGAIAPNISLPDTNGKMVNLTDFRGKLVLIDFWASWCPPCRASLPGVVKLYNKYKNKGFTVLSVSLDKEKSNWLNAIHKFHLTWTQVSDLKYWNSTVVSLYNFNGIPYTVLVSADGKILDKNMDEANLDTEIGRLLDAKKM